jgi:hypothetical protein
MKKLTSVGIGLVLVAGILSVSINQVEACSPPIIVSTTTPQQFFSSATHVFSGRVTSFQKPNQFGGLATTTMNVSRYWKGNVGEQITFLTANNGAMCVFPIDFQVGEEYLVYATYDAQTYKFYVQGTGWGGPGTQPLKDAGAHLAVLGEGKIPNSTVPNPVPPTQIYVIYNINKNLTLGSTGIDVITLQNYLEAEGYIKMPAGVAKGYFGQLTRKGLAAWQAQHKIMPASGYFGPKTRAYLNSVKPVPAN